MKKINIKLIWLNVALLSFCFPAMAQHYTLDNTKNPIIEVDPFTAIEVSGSLKVQIVQADEYQVRIISENILKEHISADVRNGKLYLKSNIQRKGEVISVVVIAPQFNSIAAYGTALIESLEKLKANRLTLEVAGVARMILDVEADNLHSELTGASKAVLTGIIHERHSIEISGASSLSAASLETKDTYIEASGASKSIVYAVNRLTGELSGVAKLSYEPIPDLVDLNDSRPPNVRGYSASDYTDSVSVDLGKFKVKVIDGDSTVVMIGNKKMVVNEKGNVSITKTDRKSTKFNGHWQGIDIGINGLLTPDFSFDYPADERYLDLRYEKSIAVGLNFFEQNIRLNKKANIGLVSGLGLSWNNYRFEEPVLLKSENNMLTGYIIDGVSVRKSKLTNTYLTLPLFLEFQTKSDDNLYFSVGLIAGWRFLSHTKIYFNDSDRPYNLLDPVTGEILGSAQSPQTNKRNIVKEFAGFQQNPFKLDLSVRAGWSFVQIYASYSAIPLFIKNRGPELYPFAVGINLSTR